MDSPKRLSCADDKSDEEEEDDFDFPKYKAHSERKKKGEWNGYPYKVPMDYHCKVEKMSNRELAQHNKAMKQRIEEGMDREAKVRATG
ncbi:g3611 [Coccomyxa elongata]